MPFVTIEQGEKMLSFIIQNFFPLCSLGKSLKHSGTNIDKLKLNKKFIFITLN